MQRKWFIIGLQIQNMAIRWQTNVESKKKQAG